MINYKKIGFIGLGKLGLPCAETMSKKGFDVLGYDIKSITSDLIKVVGSIDEVCVDRDIIFVAVPTPHEEGYDGREPTSHKEVKDFDYALLVQVLKKLQTILSKDQAIAVISTVLPGTFRSLLNPIFESSAFKGVKQANLIYNPYLIAMGTVEEDLKNPEMIIIGTKEGVTDTSKDLKKHIHALKQFYTVLCDYPPRFEIGRFEDAECIKIFYNTFISTKLAIVNMIQEVGNKLFFTDVDKVTNALAKSNKRIMSPNYMKAGMGDGGPCHPRDNIALRWLAKNLNLGYDMFETIMTAREKQAENMAIDILLYGKNIRFSSNSFKKDSKLIDGSYSLLVQHYIKMHGGTVVDGLDAPADVLVRVHDTDLTDVPTQTTIFDPWRTYYSKDHLVVHYGKKDYG